MRQAHKKYFISVFSTSLQDNILITRLSCWLGIHDSALNHTCHLALSGLNIKITSFPVIPAMWRSSMFCRWSYSLHLVQLTSQYSYFFTVFSLLKLLPLCRWHTTFLRIFSPVFDSSITQLQQSLQQIFTDLFTLHSHWTCTINTRSHATAHSADNLGFLFDEHLTFTDQMSALSKSCYSYIRQLCCIRPSLDFKATSAVVTSVMHSKLDYCNSLYYNLLQSRIKRLENTQKSRSCCRHSPRDHFCSQVSMLAIN